MTNREDLEQELAIAEGERDRAVAETRALQEEIDRLRGLAAGAGVESSALVVPGTSEADRADMVLARTELDSQLQAIAELHNPPPTAVKPESALDVVRANNKERGELQERLRAAIGIISRVAASLGVDTWAEDGQEILDAAQALVHRVLSVRVVGYQLSVLVRRRRGKHFEWFRVAGVELEIGKREQIESAEYAAADVDLSVDTNAKGISVGHGDAAPPLRA